MRSPQVWTPGNSLHSQNRRGAKRAPFRHLTISDTAPTGTQFHLQKNRVNNRRARFQLSAVRPEGCRIYFSFRSAGDSSSSPADQKGIDEGLFLDASSP